MKKQTVWNFYARFYKKLFTQRQILIPTRKIVCRLLENFITDNKKTYKILDCGCGSGQLIFDINNKFKKFKFKIKGVDFSKNMIKIARKKNKHKNIEFYLGNFNSIIEDDKYDIILCTHALPYFTDIYKTIKTFDEMLNKDGVLYIAQASTNSLYDKITLFLLKLFVGKAEYWSAKKMKETIHENGLILNKTKYVKINKLMPTVFVMEIKKI